MSERTGLGPLEDALLATLANFGATPAGRHVKCARLAKEVEAGFGYGPRHSYDAICQLARPWVTQLPLVDGHGNFGSGDETAADARYNEARLSDIGALAVAAERGELAPLPIALINGTFWRGGSAPPFDASRVVATLLRIVSSRDLADDEIVAHVGPPVFPTGCEVGGELDALVAGDPATLHLAARIHLESRPGDGGTGYDYQRGLMPGERALIVTGLPPGFGPDYVTNGLAQLPRRRPGAVPAAPGLRDVRNVSMRDARIACVIAEGADIALIEAKLRGVWGVDATARAQLAGPLPDILRSWVEAHSPEDLRASLEVLRRQLRGGLE